jgi:hypothetical protein
MTSALLQNTLRYMLPNCESQGKFLAPYLFFHAHLYVLEEYGGLTNIKFIAR